MKIDVKRVDVLVIAFNTLRLSNVREEGGGVVRTEGVENYVS